MKCKCGAEFEINTEREMDLWLMGLHALREKLTFDVRVDIGRDENDK